MVLKSTENHCSKLLKTNSHGHCGTSEQSSHYCYTSALMACDCALAAPHLGTSNEVPPPCLSRPQCDLSLLRLAGSCLPLIEHSLPSCLFSTNCLPTPTKVLLNFLAQLKPEPKFGANAIFFSHSVKNIVCNVSHHGA